MRERNYCRSRREQPDLEHGDSELVLRASRGDQAALGAIVDAHSGALLVLAQSMVGRRADAEDLVQETLLAAFQGLGRFEGRSRLRTWLMAILVRQAAVWRRKGRPAAALDESWQPGSREQAPHADMQMDVAEALDKLEPPHREVLVLREFGGLSYQEMAEVLGVPRGTVESRLHRARQELRDLMQGYGV